MTKIKFLAAVVTMSALMTLLIGGLLLIADTWSIGATHCPLQFPLKWFGCAIGLHENLAGGLFSAAGTILAAFIAWTAVQNQNEVQREIATRNEREAVIAIRKDLREIIGMCVLIWKAVDYGLANNAAESKMAVDAIALMAEELKNAESIRPQITELGDAFSVLRRRSLYRLMIAIRVFNHEVQRPVDETELWLRTLRGCLSLIAEKALEFDPKTAMPFEGLSRSDTFTAAIPARASKVLLDLVAGHEHQQTVT